MRTLASLKTLGAPLKKRKTVIERTKETWFEAHVHRIAGEIALKSPQPDAAKAEAYFERALAVARQQQAKSWELRAAMSLARLWRDQGKPQQARELLAPVYGWFTEGLRHARSEGGEGAAGGIGGVRPHSHNRSIGPRGEYIPQDQCHRVSALALRDHSVVIGTFFLRFT